MTRRISRRQSLKLASSIAVLGALPKRGLEAEDADGLSRLDRWDRTPDRVFLGGEFWANPMEDWRVRGGWAECLVVSGNRSIHSLTRALRNAEAAFAMSVRIVKPEGLKKDGGGGF